MLKSHKFFLKLHTWYFCASSAPGVPEFAYFARAKFFFGGSEIKMMESGSKEAEGSEMNIFILPGNQKKLIKIQCHKVNKPLQGMAP